jgi:hypothetical protein
VQGLQERTGIAPGQRHSSRVAAEGSVEMPEQEDCGGWSGRCAKVIPNPIQQFFRDIVCLALDDKCAGDCIEYIHAGAESLDAVANR